MHTGEVRSYYPEATNIQEPKPEAGSEGRSRERLEELEAAIAARYEDFLIEHDPVNAGNDGLIYRMTIDEMAEDLKLALSDEGVEVEGSSAVKLLKVYNHGKARQEYEMQLKAYELTEKKAADGERVARVPRPIECRSFSIQESTRKMLNGRGAALSGRQVEIVTMDFVPGRDISEICNSWILDHAPSEYASMVETIDPENHLDVMKAVSIILKFNHMPPRGTPEENIELADRRDKTIRFLKRTGFVLADSVVEKIANTRRLLEGKGVYHNDDHERNFMVVGDPTGKTGEPEVYQIDFGRAAEQPVDEIRFYIEKHLQPLTEGHRISEKRRESDEQERLIGKIRSMGASPAIRKLQVEALRSAIQGGDLEGSMLARGIAATATEGGFEQFLGLLVAMVNDGHLDKRQADNLVAGIKKGLVVTRKQKGKTLTEIKNPFMYKAIDRYRELFQ